MKVEINVNIDNVEIEHNPNIGRNQVLVRDSNNSDWIYIVLKGSLSVVKKLKRVDPDLGLVSPRKRKRDLPRVTTKSKCLQRELDVTDQGRLPNKYTSLSLDFHPGHGSRLSPVVHNNHEVFKTPYELDIKLEQTLPGYRNSKDRLGSLNYDEIIDNFRSRLVSKEPPYTGRNLDHNGSQQLSPLDSVSSTTDCKTSHTSGHSTQWTSKSSSRAGSRSNTPLPDISVNNKTVLTHRTPQPNETRDSACSDDAASGNSRTKADAADESYKDSDEEEDDDGGCVEDVGGIEVADTRQKTRADGNRRRQKKRNVVKKTSKGVYLASSSKTQSQRETSTAGRVRGDTATLSPHQQTARLDATSPQQQTVLDMGSGADNQETIEAKLARLQIRKEIFLLCAE
ncbi:hypothetical protein ElyMa_002839900 [Elysia marginata]|uniref:Cyclic nucleotide-binding domain-containing protein n=1 Tax=Elysia marginata TaxID=1093978 RepID=A0AAV4HVL4_9GAST|nr:hypothetical protein ElyMa_002839900 [Elysia marginata]